MKPRVFISSTYYDLKHVRERLERFIEGFYFEPVLFESDNVTFEHNKSLDISCYNEVALCHMMILIIGGRYGSAASGHNTKEKREIYDKEYISITRQEYKTAIERNIPVFVFVDKNVNAEYQTFKKNKNLFDNKAIFDEHNFSFAHVDDINIFKFISSVSHQAIKTFERVEEIEYYLGSQISGMFYLYLEQLQIKQKDNQILDAVTELKNISVRMNTMVQAVGQDVLQDNNKYEDVIRKQNQTIIDFFVDKFEESLSNDFDYSEDVVTEIVSELYGNLMLTIFNYEKIKRADFNEVRKIRFEFDKLNTSTITLKDLSEYKIIRSYIKTIYPILNDANLKNYFKEKMLSAISSIASGLPF